MHKLVFSVCSALAPTSADAVIGCSMLKSRIRSEHCTDACHVTTCAQHEHTDFEIHEEDLTSEELQAFKRAVASGRMNSLLSIWTPWWNLTEAAAVQLSVSGTNRVSVQNADTGEDPQHGALCSLRQPRAHCTHGHF